MDFSIPIRSQEHQHNPLTAAGLDHLRSRLSNATRHKSSSARVERNARLRSVLNKNGLPEDARQFQEANPEARGLPRAYKIVFQDVPDEDHEAIAELDGSRITFSNFGHDSGRIIINSHVVEPQHATYNRSLHSYTFSAPVVKHKLLTEDYARYQPSPSHPQDKLDEGGVATSPVEAVSGYLNFNPTLPMGTLSVAGTTFNVTLAPEPLLFNVDVSANAGAYWSSGDGSKPKWNTESKEWKTATWELGKMQFGYNVATEIDPVTGMSLSHVENVFIDKLPKIPATFQLKYDKYGAIYTSIMDGTVDDKGPIMQTNVTSSEDVPLAPPERKGNIITSVFPQLCTFRFSPFGDTFTGAYKDRKGITYAVRGVVVLDGPPSPLLRALGNPSKVLHAYNKTPLDNPRLRGKADTHLASDAADATPAAAVASPNGLVITTLLGLSPMVEDSKNPSGYRDTVASQAMDDFHNIIVYYMDDGIRKTFIGPKPQLDPRIKAIADDNPSANKAFYKKLQTPYLAAFLGVTPSSDGNTRGSQKHINVVRAQRMLQEIPANDPVYQRHSQMLYTLRFNDKFSVMKSFIADQRDQDYDAKIDNIANDLKNSLNTQVKQFPGDPSDPKWPYKDDLNRSLQDVDLLARWAKDKRLYWAMVLLRYVQNSMLPNWYAQQTTGSLSSSVGMLLKTLNSVFSQLENNEVKKDGTSFMGTFNQLVRLFQMSSIVPQLIDSTGAASDIDDIIKECLFQFIDQNKNSTDPEMMQQLAIATELYNDQEIRRRFVMVFAETQRLLGSMATWASIMARFMSNVKVAPWITKVSNATGKLAMMSTLISVGMLMLPLLLGGFQNMTAQEKTMWGVALGQIATKVIIAVVKGYYRISTFWSEVASMGDRFNLILGRSEIIEKLMAESSELIPHSFARYFIKLQPNAKAVTEGTRLLEQEGAELPETEAAWARMFGRNIDELMGTVFGVIMAMVTIILVGMDLAKEDDPLMIASDSFMIASAAIQLLAVSAGWVAAFFAEAGAILGFEIALTAVELVAAWAGPVGIVLAIIGVIIFIVWNSLQDHRSPLDKFIDDYVKHAGLYMEFTAVDYISNIAPNQTRGIELVGLSIKPQSYDDNKTIQTATYMYAKAPPSSFVDPSKSIIIDDKPSLDFESGLTYSLNDIWSIDTDGSGHTYFTTAYYSPVVKTPDGSTTGGTVRFYNLSTEAKGKGLELVQQPRKGDNDYDNILKRMQWKVDTMAEPKLAPRPPKSGNPPEPVKPVSAKVTIRQGDKWLAPVLNGNKRVTGLDLVPQRIWPMFNATWQLEMRPMGPGTLRYRHNPWQLLTTSTDERNFPSFDPAIGSRGMNWTVTPALDEPFELVQGSGGSNNEASGDEGCIRMKEGQMFSGPVNKKDYTVTCTLKIPGAPDIVRSAVVSIQVDQAESPAAPATPATPN